MGRRELDPLDDLTVDPERAQAPRLGHRPSAVWGIEREQKRSAVIHRDADEVAKRTGERIDRRAWRDGIENADYRVERIRNEVIEDGVLRTKVIV